jgi:hypothetical protein
VVISLIKDKMNCEKELSDKGIMIYVIPNIKSDWESYFRAVDTRLRPSRSSAGLE